MSLPDIRPQANLLSEFVLATLGALGLGLPMAIGIIWICSRSCVADAVPRANNAPVLADSPQAIMSSLPECGQIFGHLRPNLRARLLSTSS